MGGNSRFLQLLHQPVAHLIVDDALSGNRALFQAVKRGRIILIIHDQQFGVIRSKDPFCFSLVELFQLFHICSSHYYHFPLSP